MDVILKMERQKYINSTNPSLSIDKHTVTLIVTNSLEGELNQRGSSQIEDRNQFSRLIQLQLLAKIGKKLSQPIYHIESQNRMPSRLDSILFWLSSRYLKLNNQFIQLILLLLSTTMQ